MIYKKTKRIILKLISKFVFWIGLALIGFLLLPTGLFLLTILGIWKLTDLILSQTEGNPNK